MLENLFGSKTRVKLLNLFFNNPEACFYVREISRDLKENINSIRREIINLEKLHLIKPTPWEKLDITEEELKKNKQEKRKYYRVNKNYTLYNELKDLIIKSKLLIDEVTINKLKKLPGLKSLILAGIFVNDNHSRTDILIIGSVNRTTVRRLISQMERCLDHSLRYSIMTEKEFNFRNSMTDKFLFEIMEGKKIVALDKVKR